MGSTSLLECPAPNNRRCHKLLGEEAARRLVNPNDDMGRLCQQLGQLTSSKITFCWTCAATILIGRNTCQISNIKWSKTNWTVNNKCQVLESTPCICIQSLAVSCGHCELQLARLCVCVSVVTLAKTYDLAGCNSRWPATSIAMKIHSMSIQRWAAMHPMQQTGRQICQPHGACRPHNLISSTHIVRTTYTMGLTLNPTSVSFLLSSAQLSVTGNQHCDADTQRDHTKRSCYASHAADRQAGRFVNVPFCSTWSCPWYVLQNNMQLAIAFLALGVTIS